MAQLEVIGSGSNGNCYVIRTSNGILGIELGCPWTLVLPKIKHDIKNVAAFLVTHNHSDHAKSISHAAYYRIPVLSCHDVAGKRKGVTELDSLKKYAVGSFKVSPIPVEHNVQNFAYLIEHEEFGRLLFATDCICFPYRVKDVNHLFVEANYSTEVILSHVCEGDGINSQNEHHMEIGDTVECVKNLFSPRLRTVCLIHLSDMQSDAAMFKERIYDAVGIAPYVADKGMVIELTKDEF